MNKVRIFGLLLAAAMLFSMLSVMPVFAQTGSLEVTSIGPSGELEKDVKVTVLPLNSQKGQKGKDKKSNATGVALFDKLNNGYYRVVARKEGFAPAYYEIATVQNGKVPVVLRLALGLDKKLYFEDPMVERQAAVFLQDGMRAGDAGNQAEAEKLIKQSLDIIPTGADALYYLGEVLLRQEKYTEATESFKKSVEIANLRKTIPDAPGQSKQKTYELIAQNAEARIAAIPALRASAAYESKKYDEAVALYDEAITAKPKDPVLYTGKAMALTQVGRLEEAAATIDKALALNSSDARAQQVKEAVTSRIKNAAIEKANNLLTDGDKQLEYDVPAALKKFQEANALTGENQPVIWLQIAKAQAKLNNESEAVAAFKKAIELAPADQQESYQMSFAQFYLNAKKPDEALDLVAAGGANPEQKLLDLVAKSKNSDPAFAEAALERVIKLNPANADAYYDLGRLYFSDGKEKDSRTKELLNRYVEIGKDASKVEEVQGLLIIVNRRSK